MSVTDRARTISSVSAGKAGTLHVVWSDDTTADLDLGAVLADPAFVTLRDPTEFSGATVGEWGHSVVWPSGIELGADSLWRDTLSATGRDDARQFLEWRLRNGLSLSKAARVRPI